MAEAQGTRTDTTTRPKRVLNQATVDYRRLHRGLSLMQNDELGAEGESRPAAGTKTKQATSETLEKAGEKTLQVQMIQKVLEQLASIENQMKQMEDRSKQIEEHMAKMPEEVQQQVKTVVQGEVTNIVQKVTNIVEQ
jgi:hypothetical protein